MGLFESIKNTVKNVYDKVDTAVGGVLPGGVSTTPSTPTSTSTQPVQPVQPTSSINNTALNSFTKAATQTPQQAYGISTPSTSTSNKTTTTSNGSFGTYNTDTGVYTNPAGQGFSSATAPEGATLINNTSSANQPIQTFGQSYTAPQQTSTSPSSNAKSQTLLQRYKALTGIGGAGYQNLGPQDLSGLTPEQISQMGFAAPITGSDFANVGTLGIGNVGLKTTQLTLEQAAKLGLEQAAFQAEKNAASFVAKEAGKKVVTNLETKGAETLAGNFGDDVAKAASGVATKTGIGEVATNTVSATTRMNFAQKLSSTYKYPLMIAGALAGWVSTGVFGYNELNDDIQSLSIQAQAAIKNGDLDTAQEFSDRMEELNKLNDKKNVFGGPVFYVIAATTKGKDAVDSTKTVLDNAKEKAANDAAVEAKYEAGTATQDEIDKYTKDNPYSDITALEKQRLLLEEKARLQAESNAAYLDNLRQAEEIKTAGATARDALFDKGTSTQAQAQYEPPSSLNFGLLKTAGGYEPVSKDAVPEGQSLVTDVNEISDYYFGIPYAKLTAQQKELVDMMK